MNANRKPCYMCGKEIHKWAKMCRPCADEKEEAERLKLYTCRVIWDDFFERENSWFTALGANPEDVEEAVMVRLREWMVAGQGAPSEVSVMEVTEIVGPFEAGQILHEETGGDIKQ